MSACQQPVPAADGLLLLTFRACQIATTAAQSSADLLSGASQALGAIASCERELDHLDREMDERIALDLVNAPVERAREKLACLKCMIDLERIGDLLLGMATRAEAVLLRLENDDLRDLAEMCSLLARMLNDTYHAFSTRDTQRALGVLRTDHEVDRLRNLVTMRHLEPGSPVAGSNSVHVISMAHAIERAADHAKNMAEEVCHLVTGHSLRHLLRIREKSAEQLYLEHLRRQHLESGPVTPKE
jgi:phosphate transport system protein